MALGTRVSVFPFVNLPLDIDILYLFTQVKRRQSEADVDLRLQFLMNIELKHIKYLGI